MPQDEHPGFEYWETGDLAHPFPVGEITLTYDEPDWIHAEADIALPPAQPQALPEPATVAERSIGVARSGQLWFALECTTDLQGGVVCEAVLRGRHLNWYPEHGESGIGAIQEIRLTTADMRGFGRREQLAAHGPHCDLFVATWNQRGGRLHVELGMLHICKTAAAFIEDRERSRRNAERMPPRRPSVIVPPLPGGTPAPAPPKPPPEVGPDGAMAPVRPEGLLAAIAAFLKRLVRGLFG